MEPISRRELFKLAAAVPVAAYVGGFSMQEFCSHIEWRTVAFDYHRQIGVAGQIVVHGLQYRSAVRFLDTGDGRLNAQMEAKAKSVISAQLSELAFGGR